jgi:ABC-type uncharacterized transport system substrate-binding protein
LFAALAFLFLSPLQADPLRITLVLSEEGGAYQSFSDLLRVKLPMDEFALNTVGVDQPLVTSDLYIAVGTKAAAKLASKDDPVLSVLVPKAAYEELSQTQVRREANHTAIFLDQPLERQVALLQDALPTVRQVGVLYSTPPPELPHLRRLLAERNIHLHDQAVDGSQSLNDALESLLNKSGALFVLPDSAVYNAGTIRNILLATYRRQIPLIGISQAYVRAGALFALYTTPDQFAAEAAAAVRHFSESGKLPGSHYPTEFNVSVNRQVARSLDIPIKDADVLQSDLDRAP